MKIKGFDDTIKWYDQNAKHYADVTSKLISDDLIKRFLQLLPSNLKVLDIGCGGGRDTKALYDLKINVTGLDISNGLIHEAKARYPGIYFIQGDFLHLPFKDESFDGVWAHAAIVHLETIEDVTKAIKEFSRVLKSEGILYIYTKAQL